jgi:flagellar basal-body rod modification protein FlgD
MMDVTTLPTALSSLSTASASVASGTVAGTGSDLGQEDFLTLMLAQLQNQDPLKPMENGEFLSQLAQFSTVSGIDQVNTTLSTLNQGMRDFRMATASTLLGHQVLVPGNTARADAAGGVQGVVDLPDAASSVVVTYSDVASGQILHTDTLGAKPAGQLAFSWDTMPDALVQSRQPVRVSVTATTGAGAQQIGASVYARVLSASNAGDQMTLQIEDYGAINALEIDSFR